ncbi:MAG: hypothetical protein ACKO9Z_06110 [Planctomycetota bacterium]|nr:hypothetical protein [Planctomycetota bacterium]
MSLLGKVLAILNLLTLLAAGVLGAMVYAQRQNWTHTIFLANLYLEGLPVDANETDRSGSPIASRMGPATLMAMFGTADTPSTQEGFVKAMASDLIKRIKDEADPVKQMALVRVYAQPLVNEPGEWEDFIAMMNASDTRSAALLALGYVCTPVFSEHSLPTAFIKKDRVIDLMGSDESSSSKAPGDYIPGDMLLADNAVFEKLSKKGSPAEIATWAMLAKLDLMFDSAGVSLVGAEDKQAQMPGADGTAVPLDPRTRKLATARLLTTLGLAGNQATDQVAKLVTVVGPRAFLNAMENEAGDLRALNTEIEFRLKQSMERFVARYGQAIDTIKSLDIEHRRLMSELDEIKKLLDMQPMLLEERKKNLERLEADLKKKRGDSDSLFQSLQTGARSLYQKRRELQGLVDQVGQLEKRARQLELR